MRLMIPCESMHIRLSDQYDCFARLWMPAAPRGALLYLHGIQSHGAWFEASAQRLAGAGLAVLLPDRRGSGRNEIDRGHAPSSRRLLCDASEWFDDLHVRTGLRRFHVLGVSWGGKLALALHQADPARVASLTLVAPGLFPRVDLPLLQKVRVGLNAIAGRRTLFDIPLNDPTLFTADPEKQRFIRDDPLALRQVTPAFLLASRRLDHHAQSVARTPSDTPLGLFLAGRDRIIDSDRTRTFVERLPWSHRRIRTYPDAHHTLDFEPDPEPFFDDLARWLTEEVVAPAGLSASRNT